MCPARHYPHLHYSDLLRNYQESYNYPMSVLHPIWDGERTMTKAYLSHAIVQLVPGYRLQWEDTEHAYVLLYPEGMITLDLCASEVLRRCDGTHTIGEIITDLNTQYPHIALETMIIDFIQRAESEGWVRMV